MTTAKADKVALLAREDVRFLAKLYMDYGETLNECETSEGRIEFLELMSLVRTIACYVHGVGEFTEELDKL